jgi:hypothetical protein
MNETDLRRDLERASADLRPRADAETIWAAGVRVRRRRQVLTVAGAVAAAAAVAIAGVTVQALDSAGPDPRPGPATPSPPDDSANVRGRIPYLTEDQVQPVFRFSELGSVPWDEASAVRSWDPVDPVPLAENPVAHAAVVVQSDDDEPDAISVLGDDGRWRSLDLTGLKLPDSYEYELGVTEGSLSSDGTKLAIGQPEGAVVVDLTTGERTTYEVPDLGPKWMGRYTVWAPDGETLYVNSVSRHDAQAVDVDTGETQPVPFSPELSGFLDDGHVMEADFAGVRGMEIRIYDASGQLVFRSWRADDVLDDLRDLSSSGDRLAAQRYGYNWMYSDPRGPNAPATGVLVLGPDARLQTFLPVKGYGPGGVGGVLGWRGEDTVLFRVSQDEAPTVVLAWNVDSGRITRIADYTAEGGISLAADHLPTR